MKYSKFGISLVVIFLLITIIPFIYAEIRYGGNQWLLGFFFGGLPWSREAIGLLFFADTFGKSLLAISFLFLAYILNSTLLYFIGFGLEKLYKKYRP